MATFKYTIASGCDTGLTQKHSHSSLISDINNKAKNDIPRGAVISSARVVLVMSHNGGLGSADLNVWLCNNESDNSGENLISGSTNKNNDKTYEKDISSKITKNYPFTFNTSYSRIAVYYKSTTHRHYRDRDFYVEYTYSVPTYTVTVNAGTGGTVSGGGTVENGNSVTISATANKGYTFKQWNDGNTNASRSVTVTGNVTYTAEFTPKEYPVNVICEQSVSGEVCTVSGAGTYKFGDTVTLKVTNIPPHHSFDGWYVFTQKNFYQYDTETITFTLNADTIGGNEASIDVYCYILHTGFTVKVNVSPDDAGSVEYGDYIITEIGYRDIGFVSTEGLEIIYADRDMYGIRAVPNTGYEFVSWNDGSTENPRRLYLTGDAKYVAIFRLNRMLGNKSKAKKVKFNLDEVKGLLLDHTRIYEKGN